MITSVGAVGWETSQFAEPTVKTHDTMNSQVCKLYSFSVVVDRDRKQHT